MNARARRRAQTESEIADAAMEIVASQGIEALTVGRIAKEIGYTPGALYRYFPSKDAILAELHRRTITEIEDRVTARLTGLDCPARVRPLAELIAAAEAYLEFSTTDPGPFRLVAMSLAEPRTLVAAEHAQVAIPAYLSLFHRLSGLFARAIETGSLTSAEHVSDLTVAFVLALQGPLQVDKLKLHAPEGLVRTRDFAQLVVDGLLQGWGADPTRLAEARRAVAA